MNFTQWIMQKIIKTSLLTLLLLLFACQGSPGEDIRKTPSCNPIVDRDCNNSCVAGTIDIFTGLADLIGSLGLYGFADSTFNMIAAENNRPISSLIGIPNASIKQKIKDTYTQIYITDHNGDLCNPNDAKGNCVKNQYACMTTKPDGTCIKQDFNITTLNGCGVMAKDVMFDYNNRSYIFKEGDIKTLQTPIYVNGTIIDFTVLTPIRAVAEADMLCVQMQTFSKVWITLGCRYRYINQGDIFKISACMAGSACARDTAKHSQSFLPMTSVAVECMKDAINKVFVEGCANSLYTNNADNYIKLFPAFQQNMHTGVLIVVTLYVVLFGLKVVLGHEAPKKSEIFMFIIKIVLVIYFSVGFKDRDTSSDIATSSNGVLAIIMPGFEAITSTLSSFVGASAGNSSCSTSGDTTLCYYDPDSYADGYSYLSLWDSLDCRIAYYMGFISSGALVMLPFMLAMGAFLFLTGAFMFAFICFIFVILLISIIAYVVNFYIVALIALVITAYFAPIFVPMCLFKFTKGFFDAWLRLLFSFALQPVIVVTFVILMMAVFDNVMYGTCCWDNKEGLWSIANASYDNHSCINSPGYMMYFDRDNLSNSSANLLVALVPGFVFHPKVILPLFTVVLVCFLFYNFSQRISSFAAEVVGGASLGGLTSIQPTQMFDSVASVVQKAATAMIKGGGNPAAAAASMAKEEGVKRATDGGPGK